MDVLYIVIPLAVVFAAIALAAFLWSVVSGQYDDLDTPAIRAALDDDEG